MDQLALTGPVRHTGPNFWGRLSVLEIVPNPEKTGQLWDTGKAVVPITPDIMEADRRRVVLRHEGHTFNEWEHCGPLRQAGLHHAIFKTGGVKNFWPPYDGCSMALWQAVAQNVVVDGTLKPWAPPYVAIEGHILASNLPDEPGRATSYCAESNAARRGVLELYANIHFPTIYKDTVFGTYTSSSDPEGLLKIMGARTLGWPRSLYPLSRLAGALGWPHHKHIVWPDAEVSMRKCLQEVVEHRLLDMVGVLNFAAPTGHYLVGSFNSTRGNHQTDVSLLKGLWRRRHDTNIVAMRSRVA